MFLLCIYVHSPLLIIYIYISYLLSPLRSIRTSLKTHNPNSPNRIFGCRLQQAWAISSSSSPGTFRTLDKHCVQYMLIDAQAMKSSSSAHMLLIVAVEAGIDDTCSLLSDRDAAQGYGKKKKITGTQFVFACYELCAPVPNIQGALLYQTGQASKSSNLGPKTSPPGRNKTPDK